MIVFTLLFFSSFLLYLSFGIYVLMINKNSVINRSFFILCLSLCLWAFGSAMMNSSGSADIAFRWLLVTTFSWCLFPGIFINFTITLTNLSAKPIYRVMSFLPCLAFFFYFTTIPPENLIQTRFGWVYQYSTTGLWENLFDVYDITYFALILFLMIRWKLKADTLREKKQADIISAVTIITTVLAMITDNLLPRYWSGAIPVGILIIPIAIIGMGYSIVKYKMLRPALETESRYILKTMSDPVLYLDQDLKIKEVNKALINISGYSEDELMNKPVSFLFRREVDMREFFCDSESQSIENSIFSKDDRAIQCLISGTAVIEATGESSGFVCVFHDITEKKKMIDELESIVDERTANLRSINQKLEDEILERKRIQQRIQFIAYHDPLTELPNRLLFNERLTKAVLRAKHVNKKLAVLYIDLDNFKLINDSLGHQKGDTLLYYAAWRLKETIPENNLIARVGGDEFCVLLTNAKDSAYLNKLLNNINRAFDDPFIIDGHEYYITSSIGVAIYPDDGEDSETLIRNADIAMYEAKSEGKNTFRLCTDDIKHRFMEKSEMRNNLYGALDRSELTVFFQPQIRIHDNSIVGLEALMWWKHGNELISPLRFIPVAEETGLIIPMGEWLIGQVCAQIRKWKDMGFENLRISINLSENQLKKEGLIDTIISNLNDYQLKTDVLEFEITERIVFKDNEDIIRVLEELKDMGFIISIDDFGIDHSSFLNIKNLPIDKIKIDKQFVQGLNINRKDSAIVEAIIKLCHDLGLRVLAEGIETNEQLKQLMNRDCDEGQGFFFYHPMTSNQVESVLKIQYS